MKHWLIVLLFLVLTVSVLASGADTDSNSKKQDVTELAKATQNPIADMISLPLQWNVNFETGPQGHTSSVLNIQPVIPFNLNEDWNLITRTIVPVVNQQPVGTLGRQEWELGTQYQFAPKWIASTGVSYDSAMLDDGDATPAMPVGESWRWGLGLLHDYSESTTISLQYELIYNGDIKVDQERGALSGRLAGDYKDVMIHVIGASLTRRF